MARPVIPGRLFHTARNALRGGTSRVRHPAEAVLRPCSSSVFDEDILISSALPGPCPMTTCRYGSLASRSGANEVQLPQIHSQICARRARENMSDRTKLEPGDFHIAVKRREFTNTPWRWEIWAAGKTRAVAQSDAQFATMSEAMKQGKAALRALLREKFPNAA